MRPVVDLSRARLESDPFPFSVVPDALCDSVEQATLLWFEREASVGSHGGIVLFPTRVRHART